MVEKDIKGVIYHAIHQYVKTNNHYMKEYDKDEESFYLKYRDENKLYGWEISLVTPIYMNELKIHLFVATIL